MGELVVSKGGRVNGTIGRIRRNAPRILIRKAPFRIVFHHVPKCGGSSVTRALRRCFPLGRRVEGAIRLEAAAETAKIIERSSQLVREELLLYHMALPETGLISGHIPFSLRAFNEYRRNWNFITVLRHPVSRWLSAYYYNRYKTHDQYGKLTTSLEEFLESPEGHRRGQIYVRFFGGVPGQPPDIDRAVDMMKRFSVVGALEDLDGFRKAFRDRFGKGIRIPHLNRTPAPERLRAREITRELRAKVEEICEPDIAFYESVLSDQFAFA